MMTPSGRFKPGDLICLTMTNFYPQLWNSSWNVGTILIGLCSFMLEEHNPENCILLETASLKERSSTRKDLARKSGLFNIENFPKFSDLFPG